MAGTRNASRSAMRWPTPAGGTSPSTACSTIRCAKQLHDWVGGEADLRARIIRTIGSPAERFAEDHLRLLRAVRFAAQLDFTIEAGHLRRAQGQRGEDQGHQRRAHSRGIAQAVPSAARRARAGFAAAKRSARTGPAGDRRHHRLRAIARFPSRRHRLQPPPADAATSAARCRPLPALGGAAPRRRQAGHRFRRPEDGQHPLLRPREDRRGHGGGDPGAAPVSRANRSRRSSRRCAATCSSRTPCRCASPRCAAC